LLRFRFALKRSSVNTIVCRCETPSKNTVCRRASGVEVVMRKRRISASLGGHPGPRRLFPSAEIHIFLSTTFTPVGRRQLVLLRWSVATKNNHVHRRRIEAKRNRSKTSCRRASGVLPRSPSRVVPPRERDTRDAVPNPRATRRYFGLPSTGPVAAGFGGFLM